MPNLPKPAATRARRNRYSTGATLEASPAQRHELPDDTDWHAMTRVWWATVWSSPMAGEWVDGDIPALVRVARLDHEFWSATDPEKMVRLAAEIRQSQARFGLTPMDRRSLQWEIQRVEGKKPKERSVEKEPSGDPYQALRAVS